jgi:hypothetical protein
MQLSDTAHNHLPAQITAHTRHVCTQLAFEAWQLQLHDSSSPGEAGRCIHQHEALAPGAGHCQAAPIATSTPAGWVQR